MKRWVSYRTGRRRKIQREAEIDDAVGMSAAPADADDEAATTDGANGVPPHTTDDGCGM